MPYRVIVTKSPGPLGIRKEGMPCVSVKIVRVPAAESDLLDKLCQLCDPCSDEEQCVLDDLSPGTIFQTSASAKERKRTTVHKLMRQGYTVNGNRNVWSLYVIELRPDAQSLDLRPAVYVGQTSKSIDARFQEHLAGGWENRSSRVVAKRGIRLIPELIPRQKYYTQGDAEAAETRLGKRLEAKGYRVYGPQNMCD